MLKAARAEAVSLCVSLHSLATVLIKQAMFPELLCDAPMNMAAMYIITASDERAPKSLQKDRVTGRL